MATAEKQIDTETKETRPKYEYKIITRESSKVREELQKIGIMLDAEIKAEEQTRRSKTGRI